MTKLILTILILSSWAFSVCSQPTITSPVATPGVDGVSETLTWTTSVAADTMVKYGYNQGAISTPLADAAGVTSHTVILTGLLPSSAYSWAVRSRAVDAGVLCVGSQFEAYYGGPDSSVSFTTNAAPAGTFDYRVNLVGPAHVTQGFNTWLQLQANDIVSTDPHNTIKAVITGVPAGITVRWPKKQDWGNLGAGTVSTTTITNDTLTYFALDYEEIELGVGYGAATGPFTLTVSFSGTGVPSHSTSMVVTVESPAAPYGIAKTTFLSEGGTGKPAAYPAVPHLSDWMSAMDSTSYGGVYWCAEDEITPRTIRTDSATQTDLCTVSGGTQKCAWYYDGARNYFRIGDYEGNQATYAQCAANVLAVYRDGPAGTGSSSVIGSGGAIQVFLHFPEELYEDFVRNGNAADLTALDDLALNTYNFSDGLDVPLIGYQRETAYSMKDDYFENKLGRSQLHFTQGTPYWLQYHVDHLVGQLEQLCDSQVPGAYFESFMVGLQLQALLKYYEDGNHDSRIPSITKCTVDWLFANAYNATPGDQGTFEYDDVHGVGNGNTAWTEGLSNVAGSSANVLEDCLIVPAFAWLWKETGIASYKTNGDHIFGECATEVGDSSQGGGLSGTLGFGVPGGNGGKQWSQYFYWTPEYVKWRTGPVVSPSFFNMTVETNNIMPSGSPWPSVPFNGLRLWDTFTSWADLEATANTYTWTGLDNYINAAQAHGQDILYTFGNTPAWASDNPSAVCGSNGLGSCWGAASLVDWDNFVTNLVTHANGSIKYWELWNEINGGFWSDTQTKLVSMATDAYNIIHTNCPTCIVLSPSSTGAASDIQTVLHNYFLAGGFTHMDGVAFHGYSNFAWPSYGPPEYVNHIIDDIQIELTADGFTNMPLWDTEADWGTTTQVSNTTNQAYWLASHFILEASRGIQRSYWYAWNESAFGTLWSSGGGPTPAATAYAQVSQWLNGATFTSPCPDSFDSTGAATYTCTISKPNGYVGTIIWNPVTPVTYTPIAGVNRYVDVLGNVTAYTTGTVSVGLGPLLFDNGGVGTWARSSCFPCDPSTNGGPIVSNLSCFNITTTTATCSWNTDVASDAMLLYGDTLWGNGDTITGQNFGLFDAAGSTLHTAYLTGLHPGSHYDIVPRSRTIGTLSKIYPSSSVTQDGLLTTATGPTGGTLATLALASGPHQLYQSHEIEFQIGGWTAAGTASYAGTSSYWMTFSNLPTGITLSCVTSSTSQCSMNPAGSPPNTVQLFRATNITPITIKMAAASNAPIGTYTLNIDTQVISASGCFGTVPCKAGPNSNIQTNATTYALNIVAAPTFTPTPPACLANQSCPAIPDQAAWEANMETQGGWFCDETTGSTQSTVHPTVWIGNNAPKWIANTVYENGYEVDDTSSNIQRVTGGRCVSGASAPTWNSAGTTTDNSCTWTLQRGAIAGGEVNSWYYGGFNVYMQVYDWKRAHGAADYGKWSMCADAAMQAQREWYSDPANGGVTGWRKFPEVYENAIQRSNDSHSKTALTQLATNAPFDDPTTSGTDATNPAFMREAALGLNTERAYSKFIGTGRATQYSLRLETALGQIDQCCISRTSQYVQPFMLGLLSQALINVWRDGNHDARIPIYVQAAADYMWANLWVPDTGFKSTGTMCYNSAFCALGFDYASLGTNGTAEARQLNLLYAPIWAWLWQMTGNSIYMTNGDLIWDEGVIHGTSDKGKTFSQNYRWSFDYVRCRTVACN